MTIEELRALYNTAALRVHAAADAVEQAPDGTDIAPLQAELDAAVEDANGQRTALDAREALHRARGQHQQVPIPVLPGGNPEPPAPDNRGRLPEPNGVNEPDMYTREAGNFMRDLYFATLKPNLDPAATERIAKHQAYEVQKRAVTTGTLGGILPPQYLIGLYAKAGRNGRVFADQVNHQDLPEDGMSIIVPRITVGLTAGVQVTENTAVTTSDPTEVDLTVPVRTLAASSPVSRQTLERNAYRDGILFEDMIARYFQLVGSQCIVGSGGSGQLLGVLSTSGIASSTTATATVASIYAKIADVVQQINTNFGPLGYVADKMFFHPRRWGMFTAAVDTAGRPLIVPGATLGSKLEAFNPIGAGEAVGYGLVGSLFGLPVFTDANIPINLGAGTNEDRIIVACSNVSHLWERPGDPVTLSFEQTTGTSLQVNLVVYGYAAFTAGRYPGAAGVVSGAGLVTPTF